MRILSNSAKFSAGRPLLTAYNFSATMATISSTYRLGLWPPQQFLAIENMPPYFSAQVCYDQRVGTEVDLGRCDIVLDGDPACLSTQRSTVAPTFRPTALARITAGPHFTHKTYCRLGSARRAALVAILPGNCHPSSSAFFWFRVVG